jgi:hypothetical protein
VPLIVTNCAILGRAEAFASKKLVTGPNGIMVAQTFCDIFFMKKRHADFFISKKNFSHCHGDQF